MDPLVGEKDKRQVALFIPYRKDGAGTLEFFLQLRDAHAPVHANMYSLFGGGIESGEDVHTAVMREIEEELGYLPQNIVYFSNFETVRATFAVFIEEVGSDFESKIIVKEGQGGVFLSYANMAHTHITSPIALAIAEGISAYK